ncbi:TPA: hypothetical protein ENX78_06185 [Candidatus Poribacteria bacterium]|nr:hypothetical protein [Candidatus Poribacteria bacterium]
MMQSIRFKVLLTAIESFIKNALNVQVKDELNSDYGGFRCPDHLVCEPWSAINTFATIAIIFLNPKSRYYHSSELLKSMKMALQFIKRSINDDGSMNVYFWGEIRTKSTLPFVLNTLMKSYRLLAKHNIDDGLINDLGTLIKRCIEVVKSCPIENSTQGLTIASALIDFDKLFFDRSASDKAISYLFDRVDINHDGMYGGKSLSISMLSNAMLLNIAKKLNRPYMIDYVRRNLNFVLHNFRQDGGFALDYMINAGMDYTKPLEYSVWKEMSIIDHNGYYATAGDMLVSSFINSMENGYINYRPNMPHVNNSFRDHSRFFLTSNIGEFLLVEDELNNEGVSRLSLPSNYVKTFIDSNIARFKNGKMNAILMTESENLFSLENGQAVISHFRIKYKYYGYHIFMPKKLEIAGGSYILRDWFYHNKDSENIVGISQANLIIQVEFVYKHDHFEVLVSATGEKGIAFLLEFGIKKIGTLSIDNKEHILGNADLIPMDGKEATIKVGSDIIKICGGIVQHKIYCDKSLWVRDIRNVNIVMTPITPFSNRFNIFWK